MRRQRSDFKTSLLKITNDESNLRTDETLNKIDKLLQTTHDLSNLKKLLNDET